MYPSNGYANTTFPDNDYPNLEIQDLSSSSSCLFHFPSPLNQYEDEAIYLQHFHSILSQNDLDNIEVTNEMTVPENTANPSLNNADMKEHICVEGNTDQPVATKRMSKKDRHSKINTAHGPRDRRMRLSLDVARKFFGLQDVLGFDKASKTVEWLLKQSKMAIKELTGEFPQMNKGSGIFTRYASTSDCEVVSGIEESVPESASTKTVLPSTHSKNKRIRKVRKPALYPFAKESRKRARERARERTKDKKKQQELDDQQSTNLKTWSPIIGTGKELAAGSSHNTISYNSPSSFDHVEEMQNASEQHMNSQGIREEIINISDPNLFIIAGNWSSPSTLLNYQHSSEISHQFADFQFYGNHN